MESLGTLGTRCLSGIRVSAWGHGMHLCPPCCVWVMVLAEYLCGGGESLSTDSPCRADD